MISLLKCFCCLLMLHMHQSNGYVIADDRDVALSSSEDVLASGCLLYLERGGSIYALPYAANSTPVLVTSLKFFGEYNSSLFYSASLQMMYFDDRNHIYRMVVSPDLKTIGPVQTLSLSCSPDESCDVAVSVSSKTLYSYYDGRVYASSLNGVGAVSVWTRPQYEVTVGLAFDEMSGEVIIATTGAGIFSIYGLNTTSGITPAPLRFIYKGKKTFAGGHAMAFADGVVVLRSVSADPDTDFITWVVNTTTGNLTNFTAAFQTPYQLQGELTMTLASPTSFFQIGPTPHINIDGVFRSASASQNESISEVGVANKTGIVITSMFALPSVQCSGAGTVVGGSCVCAAGVFGKSCEFVCDPNQTCNGRGTCGSSGQCECNMGYSGMYCQEFIGWPDFAEAFALPMTTEESYFGRSLVTQQAFMSTSAEGFGVESTATGFLSDYTLGVQFEINATTCDVTTLKNAQLTGAGVPHTTKLVTADVPCPTPSEHYKCDRWSAGEVAYIVLHISTKITQPISIIDSSWPFGGQLGFEAVPSHSLPIAEGAFNIPAKCHRALAAFETV
eukprot:m.44191 g.44191  ORF g.44191 m.44191 type:complete len:559 (+) comp19604_c0_seq1:146-1822(+)